MAGAPKGRPAGRRRWKARGDARRRASGSGSGASAPNLGWRHGVVCRDVSGSSGAGLRIGVRGTSGRPLPVGTRTRTSVSDRGLRATAVRCGAAGSPHLSQVGARFREGEGSKASAHRSTPAGAGSSEGARLRGRCHETLGFEGRREARVLRSGTLRRLRTERRSGARSRTGTRPSGRGSARRTAFGFTVACESSRLFCG